MDRKYNGQRMYSKTWRESFKNHLIITLASINNLLCPNNIQQPDLNAKISCSAELSSGDMFMTAWDLW